MKKQITDRFVAFGILALLVHLSGSRTLSGAESRTASNDSTRVTLIRVPNGGIQPQAMADAKGVVHLIYLAGDPKTADVYYVRSERGAPFSEPVRVNGVPGSAITIGNIRGAHLAIGKSSRVHVTWMGSDAARPRAPGGGAPMLYARMNDAGTAFEPERNLIQKAVGLDGGGSVAADADGRVFAMWHAPEPGSHGEQKRRIWLARSTDEGQTIAEEVPVNADTTGVCGCCGMRVFAGVEGTVFAMYRSATTLMHRDMYLLTSTNKGDAFHSVKIHSWTVRVCPMSSMAFTAGRQGTLAAWETEGQVFFARIEPGKDQSIRPITAPGVTRGRRHPVLATDDTGQTILVWTEGMAWNKGGSLAWQVFDDTGKPTAEKGEAKGVPVWSTVAVFARPNGRFSIVY